MAAGIFAVAPFFPARDRNGDLVSGARMAVFQNRTTKLVALYQDENLATPAINPVIANASGQFPAVWAEAGTEEAPVLYTISFTARNGASIGNPGTFYDYRPGQSYDTSTVALVAQYVAAADEDAERAEDALAQIEQIASGAPDAPSVVNKANRDGDNLSSSEGVAFSQAISAVRSSDSPEPINIQQVWISRDGVYAPWNPSTDPVEGRSTPETSLLSVGVHMRDYGGAGVGYQWGINSWITNGSTKPFTCISAVANGWLARAMDATAAQCGDGGDAHAIEILSGQRAAEHYFRTQVDTPTLTFRQAIFEGSRYCVGNSLEGSGIPPGTTIVSMTQGTNQATGQEISRADRVSAGTGYVVYEELTLVGGTYTRPAKVRVKSISGSGVSSVIVSDCGDYSVPPSDPVATTSSGAGTGCTLDPRFITSGFDRPDTILMSANATATSSLVRVYGRGPNNQNIGSLYSGIGNGGADGSGNGNGRAIQFQSYGDAAYFSTIVWTGLALRTDGQALRMTDVIAAKCHYMEDCQFGRIVEIDGGSHGSYLRADNATFSEEFMNLAGVSATRGINFSACTIGIGLRFASGSYTNILSVSSLTCSSSVLLLSAVTATNGLFFSSGCVFSGAAINLQAQNIATDTTTGMKIGTAANQKIGLYGVTPVVQPSAITAPTGGSVIDAESRAAITSLIAALKAVGVTA